MAQKLRRLPWQRVPATCSVHRSETTTTGRERAFSPTGKWKSEGERLWWPRANMSHWVHVLNANTRLLSKLHGFAPPPPPTTTTNPHIHPAPSKVTLTPAIPSWLCFPTWRLENLFNFPLAPVIFCAFSFPLTSLRLGVLFRPLTALL